MKGIITEMCLAIITGVVAILLLTFLTSETYINNTFGRVVGNEMVQADGGEYKENGSHKQMVTRQSPTVSVAISEKTMTVGGVFDLLSVVSAKNADGKDLTPFVICRIEGQRIPQVFNPSAVGTYYIEYYVVDSVGGVDFGRIGRNGLIIKVE